MKFKPKINFTNPSIIEISDLLEEAELQQLLELKLKLDLFTWELQAEEFIKPMIMELLGIMFLMVFLTHHL